MEAPLPFPLHWHTEPLLVGSLLLIGWIYALCIGPFRFIWDRERQSVFSKSLFFYGGLVLAYLSVGSPLDQLGEDFLFSLHMVQHLLIGLPVPFFLIKGLPRDLIDYIFKKIWFLKRIWGFLVHPGIAAISFTLSYSLWHVPVLYELALVNKPVHVLEHVLMFVSACQMWWPMISPSVLLPKSKPAFCMLYIILLMIGQFPVLGMLTLSEDALYTTYTFAPKIVPWNAWEDQVLGGVIMSVTTMIVFFGFFSYSFYKWYHSDLLIHSRTRSNIF